MAVRVEDAAFFSRFHKKDANAAKHAAILSSNFKFPLPLKHSTAALHFLTAKTKNMKPLSLFSLLLGTAFTLCCISCGGNEQKTTETAGMDTTTSEAATASPNTSAGRTSTVITTPENILVARHKVSNYEKWKSSYEAHDSMRLANGLHSYVIGRGLKDTNTVLVAVRAEDMKKAQTFAKDPSLKQAMQKGGVTGSPVFNFPVMVYQDTAQINSDIRSFTTFRVKDWDVWKNKFDSGRQVRMDNGLLDRAYGYDATDKHKVIVVVAVMDSAKAYAFWKSDQLKQARKASGVMDEPQRFLYRITQLY